MTDEQIEDFEEYALSLEKATELLSGVSFTETEDASWIWSRPEDDGQYVAQSEGDWIEIFLTERDGDLVLSGHHDAPGSASFEGNDAKALRAEARHVEWRVAKDLDAVRKTVEDETAGYARQIEYACGWTDGNPDEITVTEKRVTVRYGGGLPPAVAGPLKDNIVDALRNKGFDYMLDGTVRIAPVEGVDD